MPVILLLPPIYTSADDGLHTLDGTALIAGTPDAPVRRRVQLLRSTSRPVRAAECWSDAAGLWRYTGIAYRPPGDGYTVIAYDHTGVHDPVAKANLVPTPMPPDPAEHP